ncbi:hypothetical protein ACR78Z_01155 [Sphingobacterium thalpophilum]|nr:MULTISPECIES: hypothetical protein [Sphingobacterium]
MSNTSDKKIATKDVSTAKYRLMHKLVDAADGTVASPMLCYNYWF